MATRRDILLGSGAMLLAARPALARVHRRPNVVLIYADDLGYGDLGCYGSSRLATPHLDRLAKRGTRFVNGHSPSATCTPSRYSMLTGDYAWRAKGTQILPGDAPALIRPGRFTMASMLRSAGYATGVVGKWHLGMGNGSVDWNKEIGPGPLDIGFDYSFVIPATLDRVPTVFVDGRHVANLDPTDPIRVDYKAKVGNEPTGVERPDLLRYAADREHSDTIVNGISRIGYMSGGKFARWKDEDIADTLLGKATAFMAAKRAKPFFLYFPLADPHVPRAPHPRFVGVSGMGPRGDAIVQLDWMVGELVLKLTSLGIADDTLVLFTSDNGPVLFDGYQDKAVELAGDHHPAGPLAGGKYSIHEGGTRVPMITCWPGHVRAGHVSSALVSQVDFAASLAALTDQALPRDEAVDSLDMLDAILGRTDRGRDHLVEDTKLMTVTANAVASDGARILALRAGQWKFVRGSVAAQTFHGNAIGTSPDDQLFDLTTDPGERHDLSARMPQRTRQMAAWLDRIEATGRSRA